MLNNRDPGPHICAVQSNHHVSKYAMGAWLQFVCVSKRKCRANFFLLEFSFPLDFFILHSTKADDVQIEWKES